MMECTTSTSNASFSSSSLSSSTTMANPAVLEQQFLTILEKYGWTYDYYQQLLLSHGHLLDQPVPVIQNVTYDPYSSSNENIGPTVSAPSIDDDDTLSNSNHYSSPLSLVMNDLTTKPPLSTCVTVRKTINRHPHTIDDKESPSFVGSEEGQPSTDKKCDDSFLHSSPPSSTFMHPPNKVINFHDDEDDEDDGPIVNQRKIGKHPHNVTLSSSTPLTKAEQDEEDECTTSLAELLQATRSKVYGSEYAALPTSPYDNISTPSSSRKKSFRSPLATKITSPLTGSTRTVSTLQEKDNSPEIEYLSTRVTNININDTKNKENAIDAFEYEEDTDNHSSDDDEGEDTYDDNGDDDNDDDEYDYNDGFLVDDDDVDDDDYDDDDDEDDDDESVSEEEDDAGLRTPPSTRTPILATPRTTTTTTTTTVLVPKSVATKPPSLPPRTPTTVSKPPTHKKFLNSTPSHAFPSTPLVPVIHTKTKGNPCACRNPSCTLRTLRDGDTDPSTGRIFIKEEHDKGAGKAGLTNGKKHPKNNNIQQQDQLWNQIMHSSSSIPPIVAASAVSSVESSTDLLLTPPPLPLPGETVRYRFRSRKVRDQITFSLYKEYNTIVFSNRLPLDLKIEWDSRLRTTAGLTHQRIYPPHLNKPSEAWISLSIKVVDTPYRLSQTLLHEMCHVAQFLIDNVSKPPHGKIFMKWAKLASLSYPGRTVTVCHNYEIHFKYIYVCESCGSTIRRHSKSITENDRCGRSACYGKLILQAPPQGGTVPSTPTLFASSGKDIGQTNGYMTPSRTPSEYQRFCNLHRNSVKKLHPSWNASQIMSELARLWNEYKKTIHSSATTNNTTHSCSKGTIHSTNKAIVSSIATVFNDL